jgi:hypothetical protein
LKQLFYLQNEIKSCGFFSAAREIKTFAKLNQENGMKTHSSFAEEKKPNDAA